MGEDFIIVYHHRSPTSGRFFLPKKEVSKKVFKKSNFIKTKNKNNNLTDIQKAVLKSDYKKLKNLLEKKPDIRQNEAQWPVTKVYDNEYGNNQTVHHVLDPELLKPFKLANILFKIRIDFFKQSKTSLFTDKEKITIDDDAIRKLCMALKPEGKVLTLLENFNS